MIKTLYILFSWQLPWRFKAGISGNLKSRIAQIAYELSNETGRNVEVKTALAVPVFMPEAMERLLHSAFSWLRAYVPYHAGHTEWFTVRNFIACAVFIGCCREFDLNWKVWHLLIVYFFPLPLDAIIILAGIFVIQLAAGLFLAYAAWVAGVSLMA